MNVYTVRRESDFGAVGPCDDLAAAVALLGQERLVHAVHPEPGAPAVLRLVITDDADNITTGEVVVRYAAGLARH